VIYLQIQVGKLIENGFVNKSSIYWQPPPQDLTKNVHTFSYEKKRLLLDDLQFDDAILTGIQFIERPNKYMFALNIFGQRVVNLWAGTLQLDEISLNRNGEFGFKSMDMNWHNPGLDQVRSDEKYWKTTQHDNKRKFIQFGISNIENDEGQTFVPSFIGNDITTDSPCPLSGIGLMHYTNEDDFSYAGHIKPYLKTFSFHHLIANLQ
jgi:hypothetical protein